MISLVYQFICKSCQAPNKGVMVETVRVNKGSLRTTGKGLGFIPRHCEQCRTPIEPVADRAAIHDDDFQRVNAYRVRKGWPELTTANVVVRQEVAGNGMA
jgi:hypothetical protein